MYSIDAKRLVLAVTATFSIVAMSSQATMAQANEWKKEKTADGKVSVEYRVSRIKDASGEEAPLIEYKTSMIESVGFERCISVLVNPSNHKTINDDETSELVTTISETEWILYYSLKIPWPLPKTDCVVRMIFSRDTAKKSAEFTLLAAPDLVPSKGKKRFSNHRISYTLKDLGNGKVDLSTVGRSSPPFKIPLWMIRANFPNVASDPLRNIVKLATVGR